MNDGSTLRGLAAVMSLDGKSGVIKLKNQVIVAVLGAGSFGTSLAIHLARLGHTVRLWAATKTTSKRALRLATTPATSAALRFRRG